VFKNLKSERNIAKTMHREAILAKATEYVTRDRNATHGEPENNFQLIADLQSVYIKAKNGRLAPHDIAALNILQKLARIVTSPEHPDHWTDIAGYAACGGECAAKYFADREVESYP